MWRKQAKLVNQPGRLAVGSSSSVSRTRQLLGLTGLLSVVAIISTIVCLMAINAIWSNNYNQAGAIDNSDSVGGGVFFSH